MHIHKKARLLISHSVLSAVLLMSFVAPASAVPVISNPFAFTENRGPNTAGFTTGQVFQLGATVDDLMGVPGNIALVTATLQPSGPTTPLSFVNVGSIFTGLYLFFSAPYAGEMGQWVINATNLQSENATVPTSLLDPQVIPVANNLVASGSLLAPLISWDPILFDDDNNSGTPDQEVDFYRIRLLNNASDQFYRSPQIFGNSFQVPSGLIVPGVTTIRLVANDLDNGVLENRSSTFTQFVAVPEPATVLLMGLGLAGLGIARCRRLNA